MSAQHTPGPWAVSQNTNFVFGRKQGNGLEPLGFIYGPSFAEDSEVGQRALADTRLCAAAPELLTWLRLFIKQVPEQSKATWQYEQALATIAKATGEAP